ncbi:MAG: ATP-binding cassette domain-containing protein [Actinobacteria bacterium]|nr:ATP-binding cassette domain-containing protein [Actinomycetota bacterium]
MTPSRGTLERDGTAVAAVSSTGLRYRFGSHVAVDGVDLEIGPGEVFGLLGPNGAGKTTTIRILTTLLPIQEGAAQIFGTDVSRHPMQIRRLLGYVPQQLSADGTLTGRENVSLFARLFDVPRRERAARVDEVLDEMDVGDAADRLVATYSGGMVRRLELAQALVSRPRLLILDEPTIGLDPVGRSGVWERVRALNEDGMTVLLTTHYMDEADALCDRIALMHRARIRALGTPTELKQAIGPEASLEDVFRHHTEASGDADAEGSAFRDIRTTRRTAGRLG